MEKGHCRGRCNTVTSISTLITILHKDPIGTLQHHNRFNDDYSLAKYVEKHAIKVNKFRSAGIVLPLLCETCYHIKIVT